MSTYEEDVLLELHTTIDDGDEVEENTSKQTGSLYQRENVDVLMFEEKLDDGSVVKNMMTIHSDKVSIKRSGPVSMHQKLDANRITENVYHHPHGTLHMETKTLSMDYQPLARHTEGFLRVHYTVKLNGQNEREHTLTLSITEEGP